MNESYSTVAVAQKSAASLGMPKDQRLFYRIEVHEQKKANEGGHPH